MKELWRGQLDLELTQLDALGQQIAAAEKRLEVIAENHEDIQRLRTIPGVGPRTAEVIVTALDDVQRFKNAQTNLTPSCRDVAVEECGQQTNV